MSLIELSRSDGTSIVINLAGVSSFRPARARKGTEFVFSSGDGDGWTEVQEDYREIVAVLRTHQGAAFIPARDLIAAARRFQAEGAAE